MAEPAQPDAPLFSCQDIDLSLGGRQILRGVSLDASEGQILGIIGPNGAGKTSLFEVLSGRIFQNRGKVEFEGRDISRLTIQKRLKAGIGRTYQSPVVPNSLTVAEVLKAARKAFFPRLTSQRAEWAADIMRFKAPGNTVAGSLDTLDRRKLLLTCLLMRRPRVLLLDEPYEGLAPVIVDEIEKTLIHVKQQGMTTIIVEQNAVRALELADRAIILDTGSIVFDGTANEVLEDTNLREEYLAI